ncbi:MAG: DUF3460 family protein [Burkholderiaceae bacterium]|nr:DUF3460 family protein [Burkholderiaceae bacterium]
MHLFNRPEYLSEFTRFLDEFRQSRPHIAEEQRAGLALLWDKAPIDLDRMQRTDAARTNRGAYVYE